MSDTIIDCKMLVREVSKSRCFYIDHGTFHNVLFDTLDVDADREAMESQIAAIRARVGQLEAALKQTVTQMHGNGIARSVPYHSGKDFKHCTSGWCIEAAAALKGDV